MTRLIFPTALVLSLAGVVGPLAACTTGQQTSERAPARYATHFDGTADYAVPGTTSGMKEVGE